MKMSILTNNKIFGHNEILGTSMVYENREYVSSKHVCFSE